MADVTCRLAELSQDDGFDRPRCWEIALSTVDTLGEGENPTGWPKLGELLSEDVAQAAMNITDDGYGLAGMAAPSRLHPSSATSHSGATEEGTGEGVAGSTDNADACRAYAERSHNPRACVRCRLAERRAATEAERLFEVAEREAFARAVNGDLSADEEAAILGRLTPLTPGDLRGRVPDPDIVDGVVASPGTLNQLDGHRATMKSLVSLSLAGAVGGGIPKLFGALDVNIHGPVLYAYLEGAQGLPRRLAAWEHYYQRQMHGVTFLHDPIDLKRPEDVEALAVLTRHIGAVLVVLDSVAKTGGGKEDIEDFSRYRVGLETLRDATRAAILVLHNTGHDTSRGRGHTTLIDGVDSAVLLQKKSDREGGGVAMVDEKSREVAGIEDLRLTFHPCGEINPKTGAPWSGVPVVQDPDITVGTMLAAHAEIVRKVLAAIDGAAEPGAAKAAEMVAALGCAPSNVAREISPLLKAGIVATNGRKTTALRYVRGPGAAQ